MTTEAYWQAWQFLQRWRAPFASAIDAARSQLAEADALVARAGAPVREADAADDPDAALAELRERVAELGRFDEALAARRRLVEWIERATAEGPLAAWRADAVRELEAIDAALSDHDVAAAQARIVACLQGVDAVATRVTEDAAKNRAAAQDAVLAWDEVCRLVRQDVRVMDAKLAALEENRANDRRLALWTLVFLVFVGLAAGTGIGFAAARAPVVGGLAGLCVGLVAGVVAWWLRSRAVARVVGEHVAHAKKLEDESAQARDEVLAELEQLRQASADIAGAARELRLGDRAQDHADLVARVGGREGLGELEGFLGRARVDGRPEVGLRIASAAAAVVVAGVAAGVLASVEEPVVAAIPLVEGASTTPAVPAVAAGAPAPPPPPVEKPPEFRSGAWSGTLGPATVKGTLTAKGRAVSGTFRLDGPDGAQECGARGTLNGPRLWMTVDGCATQLSLEGKVSDAGATIEGTGKSTITFQGKEVVAVDVWKMRAGE